MVVEENKKVEAEGRIRQKLFTTGRSVAGKKCCARQLLAAEKKRLRLSSVRGDSEEERSVML